MDINALTSIAQYIGLAGAAFAGGVGGGRKALKELRSIVDGLCDDVWEIKERLNIPQRPRKAGNGKVEVGLDPLAHLIGTEQKERAR